MAANGRITTHVLDLALGKPVSGIAVELWRIGEDGGLSLLAASVTNGDGRLDSPIAQGETITEGVYEIVFFAGDYFRRPGHPSASQTLIFDRIPIRFLITNSEDHYHIPLLVAPGGYSTYRGS
ncbi:hydroxyisourate hydrolase [Paenibacillus sp. NEAU-GSW1]|uniref:hydroxyisourate hydrolase n=1 Tax=Paenibacillus sp. NEAU-GSW1 TaxID=2682486 RepID=UPI0012E2083A|nr:hydroxyisourate hydrolase [Paenibacillus sp. NEAU-GSW1]MUT67072.1 hydroxyisourate hydrolase [Paenibacillus sp. NEAU-GSW1]